MTEKEATVYVVDVGRSMGEKHHGRDESDLDWAMKYARQIDSGNIHINWGPQWRADLMPYGGLKESGMGKEGPKYAIHEMTEMKTVIIHGV